MKAHSPVLRTRDRYSLIRASNIVIICVVAVLAGLRAYLAGLPHFPSPAIVVIAGCTANLLYLRFGGALDHVAKIFVGMLLIGLAYGGYHTYAFDGAIVLLSPMVPIFALLLLNVRAAVVSVLAVLLILLGLFVLEFNGVIPENPNPPALVALGRFLSLLALCLVSVWGVWRFTLHSSDLLTQIERQSNTDYLTGVLNRRGIEVMLDHEIGRAKRHDAWLSLVMIDVDFFKVFNDTHGHQAGDQCLVNITEIISSCIGRNTDLLGRFGGEEFLLVLPDTPWQGARQVAEKIRNEIISRNICYGSDDSAPLTITLGLVSGKGSNLLSGENLIKHADSALYEGKGLGRNCVVGRCLEQPVACSSSEEALPG